MESDLQNEVEELASLQFSEEEIMTIVGENKVVQAIWIKRGKLKAEAEVRKSILSQAKQGSSPAQKSYMDMIKNNANNKEVDYESLKTDICNLIFKGEKSNTDIKNQVYKKLSKLEVKYV